MFVPTLLSLKILSVGSFFKREWKKGKGLHCIIFLNKMIQSKSLCNINILIIITTKKIF